MAKPTLRTGAGKTATVDRETPSGAIIAAATDLIEVTAANGMQLKFRKMTAAREMQLSMIFASAVVNNMLYQWCVFAASVAEIDGDSVPFPATQSECLAIVTRIGDDGIAALQEALADRA